MKLLAIELQNYRQFYGTQRIELAADERSRGHVGDLDAGAEVPGNVTVIHGFNGAGKTTLLNAFVWCLYGVESDEADTRGSGTVRQLATERAVNEAAPGTEVSARVTLELDVKGNRFTMVRTQRGKRSNSLRLEDMETELVIHAGGVDTGTPLDPDGWVERMLPADLRGFFFISGERIEELTSPKSFESVETGVKTLLDVEMFERSCLHLRNHVSRELARGLRENTSSGGADDSLLEKEQRLVDQIDGLTTDLADVRSDLAAIDEAITELGDRIRDGQESVRDSGRLEEIERGIGERETVLHEARRELGELIARQGHLALMQSAWQKADDLLAARPEKPSEIKRVEPKLIHGLLQSGMCICGRPINDGSAAHTALQDWLLEAEHTVDETTLARLTAACERADVELRSFERGFARLSGRVRSLEKDLENQKEEREELATQTQPVDLNKLQAELDDLHTRRMDMQVEHHSLGRELDLKRQTLDRVRAEIAAGDDESEAAARLRRQKASVDRLTDTLQEIASIRQEVVRDELDEQIRDIWEGTAIKGYTARLTDNYQLVLTKQVGDNELPVRNLSTGERQILALSFVASLISQARRNLHGEGDSFGGELGGLYPLVLDSPFGALDDRYRKTVADWLPGLANQVVILVSNTQWRREVEEGLGNAIGREYILELHTPKPDSDLHIALGGQDYPYVVSDDTEWSAVKEVRRDHG